jgi:hypothetical protein
MGCFLVVDGMRARFRRGGSLRLLLLASLCSATPAPTVAPTAAPTVTPPPTVTAPPTTATPTSACRPMLDMTRQSVRANITVTVEAPDTPLANINYQADSRYAVHETNFDVVTHYSCDEASEAGFSCAEFERQGRVEGVCENCACAGRQPRCEYWDKERVRCRATYGPKFHDKLWALAACDADEGCIAVMKVGQEGYERCESVHNANRRDACGSGDFEDGRGYHARTLVCGQLGGFKPMRNRAAHGFFAFFSCLSAVLGVAAVCAPAWAPEVEPRRTATLSLSLFGVLPCCVFTLIGFAILSAWYGYGRPGEGACNPDLPAAGWTMTCIGFVFLALGASAYYMQGGFDEAQVRRGVVPVVAAWQAAPPPMAPPMASAAVVEFAPRPVVQPVVVQPGVVQGQHVVMASETNP